MQSWLKTFLSHIYDTDFEKRAIRATGEVQRQLRCPVSFHPGRDKEAPAEIMRLYQEAGGNARKAVMSHIERKINDFFFFVLLWSVIFIRKKL